jgi:hypothetical protein
LKFVSSWKIPCHFDVFPEQRYSLYYVQYVNAAGKLCINPRLIGDTFIFALEVVLEEVTIFPTQRQSRIVCRPIVNETFSAQRYAKNIYTGSVSECTSCHGLYKDH